MSYILKVIPDNLKTQIAIYLFRKAIYINKFLQNRDALFYPKYLEELKSMTFVKGEFISIIGRDPEFVILIMDGVIQNMQTNRYYEAGNMVNHDFVVLGIPM